MRQPLRVAINADIEAGSGAGGVESAIIGLVHALGKLTDDDTSYVIVAGRDAEWIRPYVGANQKVTSLPETRIGTAERLKRLAGPLRPMLGRWRRALGLGGSVNQLTTTVPVSDGFYEGLGCDLVHFAYQKYVLCALPTVYNPHDLQHLHYPQYWNASRIAHREATYRAGCQYARMVVVASEWVKEDIEREYGINPCKIQVVPWAPPTQAYAAPTQEQTALVRHKYALPEQYALYPAMTWAHKNHVRLLEAIALLRDTQRVRINLVCTGKLTEHWPEIERCLSELQLSGRVRFLGLVSTEEVRAIYQLAQFVVIPSLFEAASGPLFEAWNEGIPVACSNVTSLPQQAGAAALLFDPKSVDAIAQALLRIATDQTLRSELIERGNRRVRDFSWEKTAKAYRATYRKVTGRPLCEEDRFLLRRDWMKNPNPI